MGSNVFKLPGTGLLNRAAHRANLTSSNASPASEVVPSVSVPSFRRRPALPLASETSGAHSWALAARRRAALRLVEPSAPDSDSLSLPTSAVSASPLQPLRVLRMVEAGQAPGTAGRLRLSGRLADVCAELDRMVAAEPATSSSQARRA